MKKLIQNYLNKTLHWEYESSNKAVNYYWGISSDVLYGVRIEDLYEKAVEIREKTGDRAYLRALHFVNENIRVQQEVAALKNDAFEEFLNIVKASGDSLFKYLQNVYTNHDVHILLQDCAYLDKRSLWKRVSEKNIMELKNIKEIENGSYL